MLRGREHIRDENVSVHELLEFSYSSLIVSVTPDLRVCVQSPYLLRFHLYFWCAQGPRDTPSARAAQLGPQTLVNLFNSPLYSDVIFMVQGGS